MTIPTNIQTTPLATNTKAVGYDTTAGSEFWQRLPSGNYVVYSGVPADVAANIKTAADTDTAISNLLAGYPKRIVRAAGS